MATKVLTGGKGGRNLGVVNGRDGRCSSRTSQDYLAWQDFLFMVLVIIELGQRESTCSGVKMGVLTDSAKVLCVSSLVQSFQEEWAVNMHIHLITSIVRKKSLS